MSELTAQQLAYIHETGARCAEVCLHAGMPHLIPQLLRDGAGPEQAERYIRNFITDPLPAPAARQDGAARHQNATEAPAQLGQGRA